MGKGGPCEEGEESLDVAADPTCYPSRMKEKDQRRFSQQHLAQSTEPGVQDQQKKHRLHR